MTRTTPDNRQAIHIAANNPEVTWYKMDHLTWDGYAEGKALAFRITRPDNVDKPFQFTVWSIDGELFEKHDEIGDAMRAAEDLVALAR